MRVIIFSRVSTTIQANQRQIDELREYSQKMNFDVVKVFEEKISGGKKNEERPILLEMIQKTKDLFSSGHIEN